MSSIRSYGRRVGSLFAVAALTLATITPGLIPSFASAAQLTERSIALSNSSINATNVSYDVEFTAVGGAGSLIIDFCSNSPLIEAECTAPTDFDTASVASAGGFTATSVADNTVRVVGTVSGTTTFELTGIDNPSVDGPMYARIVTYTGTNSTNYVDAENLGANVEDTGSAAVSITDTIGVSGAVLESMTFCVAGGSSAIADNCNNGGALTPPTLELGETVGDVTALSSTAVSEGSIFTQISTNAASGAVVNLKSNASGCGGLLRAGSGPGGPENCDIQPAQNSGVAFGEAKFGVKTTTATGGIGDFLPVVGSNYNNSTFALNFNDTDESTGVTSPYGDPFLDTDGAPASNKNMEIVFGASVAPNTPAGLYSANLSLIATGKF